MSWRQGQISKEVQIGTHGTLLDAQGKTRNPEAVSNYGRLKGLNLQKQTFNPLPPPKWYNTGIYYEKPLVCPISLNLYVNTTRIDGYWALKTDGSFPHFTYQSIRASKKFRPPPPPQPRRQDSFTPVIPHISVCLRSVVCIVQNQESKFLNGENLIMCSHLLQV
jgi:hypothetical protein